MDDLKEMFLIISLLYEGIKRKPCEYKDFMAIFPKLKMIKNHFFVDGYELLDLIEELFVFNKNNILENINDETMKMVKDLFFGQYIKGKYINNLSTIQIIKHALLPYNINHCEKDDETYQHIAEFENLFTSFAAINKDVRSNEYELLRKYNNDLYVLLLHYIKCAGKLDKTKSDMIRITLVHLFAIFYFKQDDYKNDYSLIDQIMDNLINNEEEFSKYCDEQGICLFFRSIEDCNSTYQAIIKLMDESYRTKQEKGM